MNRPGRVPVLREALFAPADGRGNAPHATREQADAEGRRLNAKRYETVEQAERALDKRAGAPAATLGGVGVAPEGSTTGGWLVLGLAGLALGWALLKDRVGASSADAEGDDEDDEPTALEELLAADTAQPVHPLTLNVKVTTTQAKEPREPKVEVTPLLSNPSTPPTPKRRRKKPQTDQAASSPPTSEV